MTKKIDGVLAKPLGLKVAWLGFFMMPFENLAFAPSAGWPAVSPIIFLLALLLSARSGVLIARMVILLLLVVGYSSMGWLISGLSIGLSMGFVSDVVASVMALLLGASFYLVVSDYLVNTPGTYKEKFSYLLNGLIHGSLWALFFSILIIIGTYYFEGIVRSILAMAFKRTYEVQRFSFLFAEPSFVSVHIYGVLIPLAWLAWKLDCKVQFNRLLWIVCAYTLLSFLFLTSLRYIVDTLFILTLLLIFYTANSFYRIRWIRLTQVSVVILVAAGALISYIGVDVLSAGRLLLSDDFTTLISSDASLASRFFRINAVISSILANPTLLFTGVGVGNVGALVESGYYSALSEFYSPYTDEVESIKSLGSGPNIFNMHIRMLGEFGFAYIVFAILLFRKNLTFIYLLIGWVLIQFDSYAFYSLWIYLLAMSVSKRCDQQLHRSNLANIIGFKLLHK